MTDAELVRRFRGGDPQAFNALVGRWQGRLYNFILRYTGDREEARDLCQKVLVSAYRNIRRLRDPEKVSTWLYQIAVNTCRDELRRRRRYTAISLESLEHGGDRTGNPLLQSSSPADSRVHARDLRDLLNRALQSIPEEQRVVVLMKEYQHLKFTEIATVLELPVNTVKSRLYYGLNNLRKLLNQWDVTEETID